MNCTSLRWPGVRLLLACLGGLVFAGCTTTAAQLQTVHEAFPDPVQVASGADIPTEAAKTMVYEVAFEDVFRLASLSASQAQLNVEDVQKRDGFIFATRSAMLMPPVGNQGTTPHRFFYVISIKELAARRTQVRIAAKVQGKCERLTGGARAIFAVTSFGITEAMLAGLGNPQAECDALNSPNWALDKRSAEPEMAQFMVFLRNNLLAARLL